ncbi:MAG: kinase [Deltaproteobacteria bacterium]|nr:kinase [Deltaproteobacteria bacterium]
MIISRTPYRISFLGGGTDYPEWYLKHGGAVLATTIDKYCYLSCRYLPPFFEHKYRLVYSIVENCKTVDEIKHPAIRGIMKYMNVNRGVEIHHDGDLPARSGMGSSSSFTVGLLNAFYALMGLMPSKHDLATQAIFVEQEELKETVGSQDQVMAAYGGFNHVTFDKSGHISCRPVTIAPERIRELDSNLMLFYTCIKRTAANVAKSYTEDIDGKKRQLRVMKDLVEEGLAALTGGQDLNGFGELLHETWKMKRSLSSVVSNPTVDALYETARNAGAIGGKLTGAGGGGFLLLFVPPNCQKKVKEVLSNLIHVPFKFETSGSQIIFYDQETDYIKEERNRDVNKPVLFTELNPEEAEAWPS